MRLLKQLAHALNADARKRLTNGEPFSITVHSIDPNKKHHIEVKDGCAIVNIGSVTASVPFVPYDKIDVNYFKSMKSNSNEMYLPDKKSTNAYFRRFEEVGFLMQY